MSEVESKVNSMKPSVSMKFYDNLETLSTRRGGASYLKQEALVRDFASMEEQVSQFDQEMNEILAMKPD
jgi:hypothetical protein